MKKHVFELLTLIFHSFQLQIQKERVILPHDERLNSCLSFKTADQKTIFECDRGGRQRVNILKMSDFQSF